ncbi:glycosyltransferase family 2 protein [Streptococcus dentapri]|uniref:Glycosyltransferase family 2 protein n=1 Tax=Streptococcus dentapri TaxID=573564 RepID=A0ABV8D2F0_9STRE
MKVSIICTNFNKGTWIVDAIESFLAQETTFPFEIILVDDASSDQSPDIMRQYEQNYPDKIRLFFNETNKGIASTWIDICKEAKGQYIARCDGDDYWTDPHKLQKQVELLESRPDSKWSNSDFDMVDSHGNITQPDVFRNKIIPLITSYEDMLVLKGMTMASTWLVETQLMKEVNAELDVQAVDDTFNIQLELFRRTNLSFLEDSTTVYRMDDESDSRTENPQKLQDRFDSLRDTQLSYIDKYPNTNFSQALKTLIKQYNEIEKVLSAREQVNSYLHAQQLTIYLAGEDQQFSEENVQRYLLDELSGNLELNLPAATEWIRIDISELPSYFKSITLLDATYQTELSPQFTNGFRIGKTYLFNQPDPQIIFDLSVTDSESFVLSYELLNADKPLSNHYVGSLLTDYLIDYQTKLVDFQKLRLEYEKILSKDNSSTE